MSANGLHSDRVRDRVSGRVRVSVRVKDRVGVRACRPDSSCNLLTRRKMEFAQVWVGTGWDQTLAGTDAPDACIWYV